MNMESKLQKLADARERATRQSNARQRIDLLLDSDSFIEIDGFMESAGEPTGVVCGFGAVMGSPVAVFAQDSAVQGGAVGAAQAAKIGKVYDYALKTGIPVVGIYDSHGARLTEGVGALAAYGDMLHLVNTLSGVVPQISLVLGTCAGLSATMACSADIVIMAQKAEMFASAANGEAGTAEAAAKAGVAHVVCADEAEAFQSARCLLSKLPLNNLADAPISEYTAPSLSDDTIYALCETADAAETVAAVCDADSAVELMAQFGASAYTAVATMAGYPCGMVAVNGKLDSDACNKVARFVSVCDAFNLPVISFVNTSGVETEDDCRAIRDMARLAHVYAEATSAKITVLTGAAYGAAYVALAGRAAGSDYTIAWPNACISALEPRTAVAFLYADDITRENPREQIEANYIENDASPIRAAADGYIDDVIDPVLTRPALLAALDLLSAKRVTSHPKKHSNLPL